MRLYSSIDGLTAMTLNLSVDINDASGAYNGTDATALDWSSALALEAGGGFGGELDIGRYLDPPVTGQELLINFDSELFQASGRFSGCQCNGFYFGKSRSF